MMNTDYLQTTKEFESKEFPEIDMNNNLPIRRK